MNSVMNSGILAGLFTYDAGTSSADAV